MSLRVTDVEVSILSMKEKLGKITETFDCLKRCLEHVDCGLESRECPSAAVPPKRKRIKTEESLG